MKQVESHKSKYMAQSSPVKYQSDIRVSPDSYLKYIEKKNQINPVHRCNRIPTAEPTASHYSSTNSYKLHKDHICGNSTYSKYASPHNVEMTHQTPRNHMKLNKDKHYSSIVRKNRYDEELEQNEKLKYLDEETGNFTEDNVEEDDEEEDDHEEAGEFLDKDYEEQEADDEIDEESDTSPQGHRLQRGEKKEALLRGQQRWKVLEQHQDPRRLRYEHRGPTGQGHASGSRYYHSIAEHNIPEPVSEEEFIPTPVSLKATTRTSPTDYYNWTQSRSSTDRYDAATLPTQPTRRAHTKPEANRLLEAEICKTKKCSRCGSLSSKKNLRSTRNICRLDDRLNFPTKGPIGDEPEVHGHNYCGRCYVRNEVEDVDGVCDIPTCTTYSTKPRRLRDVKSPIYEVPEQGQKIDKISNDYPRSSGRYGRDIPNVFTEKVKRSVHTSHGPTRSSSRYVE